MATTRSKNYWRKRAERKKELVDQTIEETTKKLNRAYDEAFRNIDRELAHWVMEFADANNITYEEAKQILSTSEMEQYRMTLQEYIQHGLELGVDPTWESAMISASSVHHVDKLTEMKMIIQAEIEQAKAKISDTAFISKIAADSYLFTMYIADVERGIHIGLRVPDIEGAKATAKAAWAPDGVDFAKRVGINNDKLASDIQQLLTRACITGDSYDDLSEELLKKFELKKYEAERIVRTEATHAATQGEMAAYKTADIEEYEILVTLDERTCETCGEMDRMVFPVEEAEPGVTAPPFHPNCRCTTVGHYDVDLEGATRIARNEYGQNIHVDRSMTWKEWRDTYASNIE